MPIYNNIKNALLWGPCLHHCLHDFKKINLKKPEGFIHLALAILKLALAILEAIPLLGQCISLVKYSIVKLFNLINPMIVKITKIATQINITTPTKSSVELEGGKSSHPLGKIYYTKGKQSTKNLGIQTKDQKEYGRGVSGTVTGVQGKPNHVLKKGRDLENEFSIALKIGSHPNFVQVEKLYVKSYPNSNYTHQKLLMERIDGIPISIYYKYTTKLTLNQVVNYLNIAKNCCIHLYKKNIAWKDVNDGNLLILRDKNTIKFIDFGHWQEIADSEIKAQTLFLGCLEITGWIIKSSFMRLNGNLERDKEGAIQYPESFFGKIVDRCAVQSFHGINTYKTRDWMIKFYNEISQKNDDQMIKILENYFDAVILKLPKG